MPLPAPNRLSRGRRGGDREIVRRLADHSQRPRPDSFLSQALLVARIHTAQKNCGNQRQRYASCRCREPLQDMPTAEGRQLESDDDDWPWETQFGLERFTFHFPGRRLLSRMLIFTKLNSGIFEKMTIRSESLYFYSSSLKKGDKDTTFQIMH